MLLYVEGELAQFRLCLSQAHQDVPVTHVPLRSGPHQAWPADCRRTRRTRRSGGAEAGALQPHTLPPVWCGVGWGLGREGGLRGWKCVTSMLQLQVPTCQWSESARVCVTVSEPGLGQSTRQYKASTEQGHSRGAWLNGVRSGHAGASWRGI
jgi:hypothetical protein